MPLFENKYLIMSFIGGTFLQVIVVVIPKLAKIFNLVPLNKEQWIATAVISFMPLLIIELQKSLNGIKKILKRKLLKESFETN